MNADRTLHAFEPSYAIPPGETLLEVLESQGMTQTALAERMGVSKKHVYELVRGDVALTADVAHRLERVTGVSSRIWSGLETSYRERLVRLREREDLAGEIDWLEEMPVAELARRGWITKTGDKVDQMRQVLGFFGVASRGAWDQVWSPAAMYRKSRAYESSWPALAAWLRIGELRAAEMQCEAFDERTFRDTLKHIRGLTRESRPERWLPSLTEWCRMAGVAVVLEPEITGARVNGATKWLTPKKALIQLSLRHKWADVFWFTFFHEAAHLLLHSKKETFIDEPDGQDETEREADAFAAKTLIPQRYTSWLYKLRSWADVEEFAEAVGVGPDIVVGRLQHERRIPWRHAWTKKKSRFEFDGATEDQP